MVLELDTIGVREVYFMNYLIGVVHSKVFSTCKIVQFRNAITSVVKMENESFYDT